MDSQIDLVNDNDEVIGTTSRLKLYEQKLKHFRVINAFIINSNGELWIPTRHPNKSLFPLCLDCSIGGHVESGEDYYTAFIREGLEEVGLDPSQFKWKELMKLTPLEHMTSAFMRVYAIFHDGPINYNQDDFIDSQWIKPKKLLQLIQNETPAKGDLPLILKQVFTECND